MEPLRVVTGNPAKAKEISLQIGMPVEAVALDLHEIQSIDVRDVIEAKAREAYAHIGAPVIVDDAGLCIDELGNLPGALVRWFIQGIGNEGICRFADMSSTRAATAVVAIGYFDGTEFIPFIQEVPGRISEHPEGDGGYGWDSVFIQEGCTQTRAAVSPEEYDRISIRRPLLQNLREYLEHRYEKGE